MNTSHFKNTRNGLIYTPVGRQRTVSLPDFKFNVVILRQVITMEFMIILTLGLLLLVAVNEITDH